MNYLVRSDSGFTILLVDDSEIVREMSVMVLQAQGYAVLQASSGEEALSLLFGTERQRIDLVLLDLVMPGMDGFAVLGRIRLRLSAEEMPIVVVSSTELEADRAQALALGANDFASKAMAESDTLACIQTHLARATIRQELIAQ